MELLITWGKKLFELFNERKLPSPLREQSVTQITEDHTTNSSHLRQSLGRVKIRTGPPNPEQSLSGCPLTRRSVEEWDPTLDSPTYVSFKH